MSAKKIVNKVMIVDKISKYPVGKGLAMGLESHGVQIKYISLYDIPRRPLYRLWSFFAKIKYSWFGSLESLGFAKYNHHYLRQQIKTFKPELIIIIGTIYRRLSPKILQRLRAEFGFKIYLIDTDMANFFVDRDRCKYLFKYEFPLYDCILPFYKKGAFYLNKLLPSSAVYLPYAGPVIKQYSEQDKTLAGQWQHDVCFVGGSDKRRIMALEHLTDYDLAVYGRSWKNLKELLSGELWQKCIFEDIFSDQLYQLIRHCKIILNINNASWHAWETGANERVFLVPAVGGFLLTDHCQELADLYKIGEEIETFRCHEECRDKIAYYLKHEDKRAAIAKKGHQRFLKDHTWEKRVQVLLDHAAIAPSSAR